jgi:hypothetical protein
VERRRRRQQSGDTAAVHKEGQKTKEALEINSQPLQPPPVPPLARLFASSSLLSLSLLFAAALALYRPLLPLHPHLHPATSRYIPLHPSPSLYRTPYLFTFFIVLISYASGRHFPDFSIYLSQASTSFGLSNAYVNPVNSHPSLSTLTLRDIVSTSVLSLSPTPPSTCQSFYL